VDETVAARSAPAERLRRLLSAPDKKATLLEMAGARAAASLETCRV
jgi:hypothetical protein